MECKCVVEELLKRAGARQRFMFYILAPSFGPPGDLIKWHGTLVKSLQGQVPPLLKITYSFTVSLLLGHFYKAAVRPCR